MGEGGSTASVKRVYEPPEKGDGFRILVDRLWPRGLSKRSGSIDLWMKDVAPTSELRRWFAHDALKWPEFTRKYLQELGDKEDARRTLRDLEKEHSTITLLFAAKDVEHNQAIVLQKWLRSKV